MYQLVEEYLMFVNMLDHVQRLMFDIHSLESIEGRKKTFIFQTKEHLYFILLDYNQNNENYLSDIEEVALINQLNVKVVLINVQIFYKHPFFVEKNIDNFFPLILVIQHMWNQN